MKDARIRSELGLLREDYKKLKAGGTINYNEIYTRFAYYYRYVPAHANVVYQLFDENDVLAHSFDQNSLSVSCLGGGPGSEFWGLLRYREASHRVTNIFCDMYDKENVWSEFWDKSAVSKRIKTSSSLFPDFKYLDVMNPAYCGKYYNLGYADLFIMSFFLSEIPKGATSTHFFEKLFENAKRGSLFLFIDNTTSGVEWWFDNLVKTYNRVHPNTYISTLKAEKTKLDACESANDRKEHLEIYYEKFHKTEQPRR